MTAPPTIARTLTAAATRLAAAGVDDPRRDARLLIAAAIEAGPERLFAEPERILDGAEAARIEASIARRAAREPVSRILGRRGFWSLELEITPDTLDPRPDSETLVAAVLERIGAQGLVGAALSILDLGTGSGCLLLALLSELPAATGLGLDISAAALEVARRNARKLGLSHRARFTVGDWGAGLDESWQLIVSNPPYITEGEIAALAPEVARYDPRLALTAGSDGLDAYRKLLPRAARLLEEGGMLALEVGCGQQEAVTALLAATGFIPLGRYRDLAGIERCLLAAHGKPGDSAKK
ncbi:MAG: peptide chain release factor N(5)-glutamine methyltransferase [Alphaproteobacteria bacterium]